MWLLAADELYFNSEQHTQIGQCTGWVATALVSVVWVGPKCWPMPISLTDRQRAELRDLADELTLA